MQQSLDRADFGGVPRPGPDFGVQSRRTLAAESLRPDHIWPRFAVLEGSGAAGERPRHPLGLAFRAIEEIRPPLGRGQRHYFAFSDAFHGMMAQVRHAVDVSTVVNGTDCIKFHFKISGNNTIRFEGGSEINIRGGCAAIGIHPRGALKHDAHARDAFEQSVTFACTPAVLTEQLQLDVETLPEPVRGYLEGRNQEPQVRVMPLDQRMRRTVEELFSPTCSPQFSHLYAEARALDLICMALDALFSKDDDATVRLTARDVAALGEVRRMLDRRFTDPPSIIEISRDAGMNRTKVTQGFRSLHNETILDYCRRLRMQRARELLLTGVPVSQVADDVGYAHHSSFAQAFRRHFGYAPVAVRRRRPVR